ncbi:MAG: tRNA pseudouridine(55) synthase TruB [Gammaproteobacteria bacterium]
MGRVRKSGRNIDGVLLLDKRQGVSSNKALQEARNLFDANKAGHTGSLDPLATGLLPVCFGEATKISAYLLDTDKRYRALIQLGLTTDSGDIDGKVLENNTPEGFSDKAIGDCLNQFIGENDQVPPMYSALKFQGKRLYELARKGVTVERKSRRITIYDIRLLDYRENLLSIDVKCSKGTYIRTLAEDIGRCLGCGAAIRELRRLEVGQLSVSDAVTLDRLQSVEPYDSLLDFLLPADKVLTTMPAIGLTDEQSLSIRHGRQIDLPGVGIENIVRMYNGDLFLGIGEIKPKGRLAPKRLFISAS